MKLLLEHLKNNREALLKYSQMLSIANHPVNLGTAREGLISSFFKQNLPEYIGYHTGEVFDCKDNRSGQIDIVLHPITSPKIHLYSAINIFPAETVLAAIEVKSNLTTGKRTGSLIDSLNSCRMLKKLEILERKIQNSVVVDSHSVPFIVFAYKGPTLKTLIKRIEDHCLQNGLNFREIPDLLIVLDRGYYLIKSPAWIAAGATINDVYNKKENKESVLLGVYEYILKLIEYWFVNPSEHTMPIGRYTKDMPTLFDFFK